MKCPPPPPPPPSAETETKPKQKRKRQCRHILYWKWGSKSMCYKCRKVFNHSASVPSIPISYVKRQKKLVVSRNDMNCLRDCFTRNLLSRKKLHLLLDLDNTLFHCLPLLFKPRPTDIVNNIVDMIDISYMVPCPVKNNKHKKVVTTTTPQSNHISEGALRKPDVRSLTRKSRETVSRTSTSTPAAPPVTAAYGRVKFRPGLFEFLQHISTMYDMSISTKGCREYAQHMVGIIDPERKYIRNVISREDGTVIGQKGLDIVMYHERVVLVVDDKEHVWDYYRRNLIKIEPYVYFPERGGKSWVQVGLGEDESKEQGELARVKSFLAKIHAAFFNSPDEDLARRDVRDVVDELRMKGLTTGGIDQYYPKSTMPSE